MNFIGIDLGTSSVKIIIMDGCGKIVSSVSKSYGVSFPRTGWAEQNPDDWWNAVRCGIKELIENAPDENKKIDGIGFSGQMHGLVLLDKDYKVLRPAILWCDQRTQKECDYLNNVIGRKKLSDCTGNIALTGFTAPKILWVKKNEPEIFKKIAHILLPKDYIRFKLTGVLASDVSDASGTLLFDVRNRRWSDEMIDIVGVKKEWLPEVYESYEVTGNVKSDVAHFTGLSEKTKVAAGAGDQAAGAIGTGITGSGVLSVALGTSGVVFAACDSYRVDSQNRLHSFCGANGKWHQMGVMLSAASCLKWWVQNVNTDVSGDAFDKLLSEAADSPVGSRNLIFLPYLMGERTPHSDSDARGVLFGLDITHKRQDITRAILEGVCFGLRDSYEILKSIGVPVREVRVSGGGARSRLWRQILADVFNVRTEVINSKEGPAFGAAILASVACGLYKTVDEACEKLIKVTGTIEPNEENVQKYDKIYSVYRGMYDVLKDSYKKLAEI